MAPATLEHQRDRLSPSCPSWALSQQMRSGVCVYRRLRQLGSVGSVTRVAYLRIFSDIAVMGTFEFVKRSVRVQTPHSIGIKHCFYPLHTAQLLPALFL